MSTLSLFVMIFGRVLVTNYRFCYHDNGSKNQRNKHELFRFGLKQTNTGRFVEICDYA